MARLRMKSVLRSAKVSTLNTPGANIRPNAASIALPSNIFAYPFLDCSNEIQHYSAPVTLGDCSMTCAGNAKEWCGGPDRLNVYQFDYDGTLTPVSETSPATPYEVAKVKTTGGEWVSRGCYSDNADGQGRTLSQGVNVEGGMTIEKCAQACANAKRRFCSTEYAGECCV